MQELFVFPFVDDPGDELIESRTTFGLSSWVTLSAMSAGSASGYRAAIKIQASRSRSTSSRKEVLVERVGITGHHGVELA